jgi:hypothetical protein
VHANVAALQWCCVCASVGQVCELVIRQLKIQRGNRNLAALHEAWTAVAEWLPSLRQACIC